MSQRYFEFIEGAGDEVDALRQFSRRFDKDVNMHAYIIDHRLLGLSYRTDAGIVQRPFIDMPTEAWGGLFQPRRIPRPGR